METLPTLLAFGKITTGFCLILFGVSRHWGLWPSILGGAAVIGLLFGLSPSALVLHMAYSVMDEKFLLLGAVVFLILVLAELQESTGQGRRLVEGLTPHLRSPRLRLAFFPALIGLLPMPGGAIFSCPMVRDTARAIPIPETRKAVINYWFRHIWELTWPLYPGYILACSLADLPISLLWRYTWPALIINTAVGFVFFLRQIPPGPVKNAPRNAGKALRAVVPDVLPIAAAIGLAPLYGYLMDAGGLQAPAEVAFCGSLLTAIIILMAQTRTRPRVLPALIFRPHILHMLLIIYAIYCFKDILIAARVIDSLTVLAKGGAALLALFVILPFISAILTGLMAGFVGASFPLLIGLLHQAGLYEERLSWIIIALVAGNFGQMLSPLHTCMVVTIEFFRVPFLHLWRMILFPAIAQFVCAGSLALAFHIMTRGTV